MQPVVTPSAAPISRPIAFTIDGGISSRPSRSSAARSMLIASRCSRSGQASHGPRRDRARDAVAQVGLELAHLGLAADRAVPGDDHVGELGDRRRASSAHVSGSPWNASGVTPKKQRSPAKQHVDVGDEHHQVAVGVAGRRAAARPAA